MSVFLCIASTQFAWSNHIFPDGPTAITLCWGHVSLLGQPKDQMTSTGQGRAIVSHQQWFYSRRFLTTLRSSISSPFDDTSSFFQSITPACPGSAGSCLAVASSKLLGGRWQNGAPAVPLHLGRGSQGGKCLNLKFTTQVTGSLQLSCSNDVHCTVILMNKTTWTTSPFF